MKGRRLTHDGNRTEKKMLEHVVHPSYIESQGRALVPGMAGWGFRLGDITGKGQVELLDPGISRGRGFVVVFARGNPAGRVLSTF